MNFLNNLLDFAKRQTRDFITILRWLVLGLFFITVIMALNVVGLWVG